MANFNLKKGHNLKIAGDPEKVISSSIFGYRSMVFFLCVTKALSLEGAEFPNDSILLYP